MVAKYKEHLAANVLTENNVVSYRMLSRALKVHSNTAKKMLYEFHRTENTRKPNSVHATYLVTGVRKPETPTPMTNGGGHSQNNGPDSSMQDSFMSSSMPEQAEPSEEVVPATSMTLVKQEQLESLQSKAVTALYESIVSTHIYSLEPGPLQNLSIMSDCNRKVASEHAADNLLETWKQYGTIHNPRAQKRATRQPPVLAVPEVTTAAMKPATETSVDAVAKAELNKKPSSNSRPSSRDGPKSADLGKKKQAPGRTASLRRDNSSIFKSFAKAEQPKTRKQESQSDQSAAADSPAEDESMKDVSEGEEEGDIPAVNNAFSKEAQQKTEAARQAKDEREERLRNMMDEEDPEEKEDQKMVDEDEPMDDAALDHAAPQTEKSVSTPEEKEEEQMVTTTGRRRGRRRVMKKKTTKDAEGYLVTREEPVWESFSEEEVVSAPVKKAKPSASTKESEKPSASGKSTAGQGSIKSFFKKG